MPLGPKPPYLDESLYTDDLKLDPDLLGSNRNKAYSAPQPTKRFNFWALILLFSSLAIAEWFGIAIPGPIDDIIYDAIIILIYGGTIGIQDLLAYRRKK